MRINQQKQNTLNTTPHTNTTPKHLTTHTNKNTDNETPTSKTTVLQNKHKHQHTITKNKKTATNTNKHKQNKNIQHNPHRKFTSKDKTVKTNKTTTKDAST